MKRPRKVRAFNRVQPRMTEEDQRRQQFISPSKHKLNPYLMMHFTRTEQYTAGTAVPPWGTSIVYMNGLNSTAAFGVPSITAAAACDTYYSGVSLLLPFAGTNGSTTFTDYSISPKTITANGNAQISTAQSKFGGTSGYFDGTGDYLLVTDDGFFDFGTGDFTVEAWVYVTTFVSGGNSVVAGRGPTNGDWMLAIRSNTEISWGRNIVAWDATTTGITLNTNTWYHIAVSRTSSVLKIFVNGSQYYSASNTQAYDINNSTLAVGGRQSTSGSSTIGEFFNGYIDDLRITKGIGRYTSNFTAPSSSFVATDCYTCDVYYNSTSLILPMDGANGSTTFTDSSPSPKTVTRNGNTQISTTQSKFGGASAYFDGTGDYLTVPYTTAAFDWWTTDFTLEYWVYANDLSTFSFNNGINVVSVVIGNAEAAGGTNYWSFGPISTGVIRFYYFNGSQNIVSSTQTISINTWNHVALVKNSSGINIFVNGVGLASPVAVSGTPQSSASFPLIMGQINNRSINGYIDDVRITKGVARYTSDFTVPTSANPTIVCT